MKPFEGFPPGKVKMMALPSQFFSEVLPLLDDLNELKVILYCFWALGQKDGDFRYMQKSDFCADATFMDSLARSEGATPQESLDLALKRATDHGVLLAAAGQLGDHIETFYFVNTALGRSAVRQIAAGQWRPGATMPIEILPERPNIFALYEANIGPLTPIIADELRDAERDFPTLWIEEAIAEAVKSNIRNWRYIRAILERWKQEGKSRQQSEDPLADGKRYISGKYADWIKS
jgi:DnaD/phage-associated family protein